MEKKYSQHNTDFIYKSMTIEDLENLIREQLVEYDREGLSDSRFIEFAIANTRLGQFVFRYDDNNLLAVPNAFGYCVPAYKVYMGHGLLRAIKHYIIDDSIIEECTFMSEWEGHRFSELPVPIQRRIKQCEISITIDKSQIEDIALDFTEFLANMS